MKSCGLTAGLPSKLSGSSTVEAGGIPGVVVECVEIRKNTGGEGGLLGSLADTEARQRGEQTGLDTLVVHAVNDGH